MLSVKRYLLKIFKEISAHKAKFTLYLLASFISMNIIWLFREFGYPTAEQIVYHIQNGPEGLNGIDHALIRSYVKNVLLAIFLYAAIFTILEIRILKTKWMKSFQGLSKSLSRLGPLYLLIVVLISQGSQIHLYEFLAPLPDEDFIEKNYVNPNQLSFNLHKPKNLILIYVESLEKNYLDQSLFKKNPLKTLEALPGYSVDRFIQAPGISYTMAGIVSSQCGLPLKTIIAATKNRQGHLMDRFMPNAICIGDVLKQQGYENVFLGGASLQFAGKGKFLSGHGYDKTLGREEWLKMGHYKSEDMNYWGLHDEDLFIEARKELKRLKNLGKPFNLTILTLNMHNPKGFMSKVCKAQGGKKFEDIVGCSARSVANFVSDLQKEGYLQDTNVVILGDHLSMPNDVYKKLRQHGEGYIYNKWITEDAFNPKHHEIVHFDIAPTVLDFIGVHTKEGRFGMGYSVLSDTANTIEANRMETIKKHLLQRSEFYYTFWK
jgi:phosphoglycerol transferase